MGIDLSLNQSTNVLVRVDKPAQVWLSATVDSEAEPDMTAEVWLTATSTNDSVRSDTEIIDVAAAMVSDAEISYEGKMVNSLKSIRVKQETLHLGFGIMQVELISSEPHIEFEELTGGVLNY